MQASKEEEVPAGPHMETPLTMCGLKLSRLAICNMIPFIVLEELKTCLAPSEDPYTRVELSIGRRLDTMTLSPSNSE